MRKPRYLGFGGLALCASLSWMGLVRADIAPMPEKPPPPERPKDWDEHPAPMPEVPLEDTLARRIGALLVLGTAGYLVITARRGRTNRRQRAS